MFAVHFNEYLKKIFVENSFFERIIISNIYSIISAIWVLKELSIFSMNIIKINYIVTL